MDAKKRIKELSSIVCIDANEGYAFITELISTLYRVDRLERQIKFYKEHIKKMSDYQNN